MYHNENIIYDAISNLKSVFDKYDKISTINTEKVLNSFIKNKISSSHFTPSNGYGYGDIAREKLESVFSDIMKTEASIFRPQICSGTHAISHTLFSLLRYEDHIISATGLPYDTMQTVIGINDNSKNSLKNLGISYSQSELINKEFIDVDNVLSLINKKTKLIMIQRSRGYSDRKAISLEQIKKLVDKIKNYNKDIIIFVDNCYGEFVCEIEPTEIGVDVMAGSLIKNPGGGIAPTGGYITGKLKYINDIADRLTSPGIGLEIGSYESTYRPFYQGLFLAPHVVCQSLKIATLFSYVFEKLGYKTFPKYNDNRYDIVQVLQLGNEKKIIDFCNSLQNASPIDSFLNNEPWAMPGYDCKVIMASGTFVSGSSIELSCDAPIRNPYNVYIQGGLTLEHGIVALKNILEKIS